MYTKYCILAGEIIFYLEEVQRPVPLREIAYFWEMPLEYIESAVEILVEEGVAVLDFEDDTVALVMTPKTIHEDIKALKDLAQEAIAL